jgi:hypothetical protein
MNRQSLLLLLVVATMASVANAASGNLVVFDDADQNGFSHLNSAYGAGNVTFNATSVVHGGTIAVAGNNDPTSVASWLAPATYSTLSDYDGVSFWVNGGNDGSEDITVVLYNVDGLVGSVSMADLYGAPIPINTWIHLQADFASALFNPGGGNPTTFTDIAFRCHSSGGPSSFFFLDDIALTGADIFKNGFDAQ